MSNLLEKLLEQHPDEWVPLTEFSKKHSSIMPIRRGYNFVDQINTGTATERIRKIFRKRFGRWFVHVPAVVEYLEDGESLLQEECA